MLHAVSTPYLSMCPDPAVEWVSKQVGTSELDVGESPLSTDVLLRGEHLDRSLAQTRAVEPEFETAMRWSNGQSPFEAPLKYHEISGPDGDSQQHTSTAVSIAYLGFWTGQRSSPGYVPISWQILSRPVISHGMLCATLSTQWVVGPRCLKPLVPRPSRGRGPSHGDIIKTLSPFTQTCCARVLI